MTEGRHLVGANGEVFGSAAHIQASGQWLPEDSLAELGRQAPETAWNLPGNRSQWAEQGHLAWV